MRRRGVRRRRETRRDGASLLVALVLCGAFVVALDVPVPGVRATPRVVGNDGGVREIHSGSSMACAVLAAGEVKCWGDNVYGQLGYGDTDLRGTGAVSMSVLGPVDVGDAAGDDISSLAVGTKHVCALTTTGGVRCWGLNSYGQLGVDSTDGIGDGTVAMSTLVDIDLGTGRTATQITAGENHSCALLDNGTVKCWGRANYGQIGSNAAVSLGDADGEMAGLAALPLGGTVTWLDAGANHTCAVVSGVGVKCWGRNHRGQLGYGDVTNRGTASNPMSSLVAVGYGSSDAAVRVHAGGDSTCVVLVTGAVRCWGDNFYGQLGYGDTEHRDTTAEMTALTAVPLVGDVEELAVGGNHACALLSDETLRCWGRGSEGQLGYDDAVTRGDGEGEVAALAAVNVGASRHATSVSAGAVNTCAVLNNGTAKCWGWSSSGQLGQDSVLARGDDAGEMSALGVITLSPPVVTLTADATTSTSATIGFTLDADEPIDCTTLSDVNGVDLAFTNISAVTITQSASDACAISATSTVVLGATGTSSLAAGSTVAVADTTGQIARQMTVSDASVAVDRVPVTTASPTTVPPTTVTPTTAAPTTVTPTTVTPTTVAPTTVTPTTAPSTTAPSTTVATSSTLVSLRTSRRLSLSVIFNRAAIRARSLSRVSVTVRRSSSGRCRVARGYVVGRRPGMCTLVITVRSGRGRTVTPFRVLVRP